MEHADGLASIELKEAPPSSSSENALLGTAVPMEEQKHDKATGPVDDDMYNPCALIQLLMEAIANDTANPTDMSVVVKAIHAKICVLQEKLKLRDQKVKALEIKVRQLQQKRESSTQDHAIAAAMNASPMTTAFFSRLLITAANKEEEDHEEINTRFGLNRTPTMMQQPMMKAAAGDDMEFFRDGPHAWLVAKWGQWAVVVWQLLMYVAVGAFVLGTSSADGVCVDTSSGNNRAAVNKGSWTTGLLVALGKQLWWGRESKVVAMVEEQVAGFMPVFAASAALQVLDLSGWLPASSNGSTERICLYILDRDTELLTIAWTGVCVIGWTFAWDIVFAMAAGHSHRVTFLSLLNPLVLAPFLLAKILDVAMRVLLLIEGPCCIRYPFVILILLIFGIPVLLAWATLWAMGLEARLDSDGFPGLMSAMILFPFYLITCGVTDAWGLAGVSTAMIFVAIGALSLTVSMDRSLWMIWWLLLLLVFPHRLEDALTSDGFRDQGEVVALIVIIAYLSGPNEEVEGSVGSLRWWEPLGVAVAGLKGLSTTSVVDMDQGSVLRVAVVDGNMDVVKRIVARSPEAIHGVDSKQATALMRASTAGRKDVAEVLVAAGADVNAKDDRGWTALMKASTHVQKDVAEMLVAAGAMVNAKNNNGWTALMLSSWEGHKDIAKMLVAVGAMVNAKDNEGSTALIKTSWKGHKDVAEVLVAAGAMVNAHDNSGWTALMNASTEGHKNVAEVLVAAGADVNAKDDRGLTALMKASIEGHTAVAEVLIAAGADLNTKENEGWTALMMASKCGYKDVAEVLVAAGADMNTKDDAGETALMMASKKGHREMAEVLVAAGADVNAKDNAGWTALMWASNKGNKDVAEVLVAAGADVNAKSDAGWTALMQASYSGHQDVAEVLVAAGADVNAKNNDGSTAREIALKEGHRDIADILTAAEQII